MAVDQKLIRELINTYFPDAADDFSNIYLAVDSAVFGAVSQKMPLSVIFSATTQVDSDLVTFTGTTYSLVFDTPFLNSNYRLSLEVYKIDTSSGNTYKTSIPIMNEQKLTTGFSFELYKDYGQTIYVDYKAESR